MKIKTWHPGMTDKETADLAYWERNVLALHYAEGWYNDDSGAEIHYDIRGQLLPQVKIPRYPGWRRVLTLEGGRITFHIPDDFEVGNLPQVAANWDGHTTEEKWERILAQSGVLYEPDKCKCGGDDWREATTEDVLKFIEKLTHLLAKRTKT